MNTFQKIGQAAADLSMAAINAGGTDRARMAHNVMAVASSSLMVLCMAIGNGKAETESDDNFNPAARITPDCLLFAALFTVACQDIGQASFATHQGQEALALEGSCDIVPEHFLTAADQFEKLTGRKPDSFLFAGMVEAMRAVESQAAEACDLSAFLSRRLPH